MAPLAFVNTVCKNVRKSEGHIELMVDNINHREFAKIKSRGLAVVIYEYVITRTQMNQMMSWNSMFHVSLPEKVSKMKIHYYYYYYHIC